MNSLSILFGYHLSGLGNSSIPLALCKHWNKNNLKSLLYAPSNDKKYNTNWIKTSLRGIRKQLLYRFGKATSPRKITENDFYLQQSSASYVYLWAGLSLEVFERFHRKGSKIIIERINCHQATAKSRVNGAYGELGLDPPINITTESIGIEKRKLELADAVFCPNPMVYRSMVENGVSEHKLIPASYGWDPDRFPNLDTRPRKNKKPVFLFVGTLCVRKGIPLLLKAWELAGIDGELILCGEMDSDVKKHFGHYFKRNDISHIPFTTDIGRYYNMADVFVFPSYEEGGPMVTYEAMAHGVVPLVSEMGAGAIVQDKKNGLILDLDVGTWATAIMAVAANTTKRLELAKSARSHALQFTWDKVAENRAKGLRNVFPSLWSK